MNCTQECLSDGDCADNLKCCKAGCATVCQMPNGNPRGPAPGGAVQRGLGGGGSAQFPSGNRGATHPRVPGRVEVDGTRSACALPPMASVRSRCLGVAEAQTGGGVGVGWGREVPHSSLDSLLCCVRDFREAPRGRCSGALLSEIRGPG